MTFLEAAHRVLKTRRKPLHSKEITRIALRKRWLKTRGKTHWATMTSQILREIKAKGEKGKIY